MREVWLAWGTLARVQLSYDDSQVILFRRTRLQRPLRPPLGVQKLLKLKEKEKRKGVVYISRIPPKMKPRKLRSLLEPYGEIGRVYLAPQEEDPRKKAAKKSSGPQFR